MNTDKLTDKQLSDLVDKLCETRENNPDVVLMDKLNKSSSNAEREAIAQAYYDEEFINKKISSSVDDEILESLFQGDLSEDELINLQANGLYDKYIEYQYNRNKSQNDDMNIINEEIKQQLAQEEKEEAERFRRQQEYLQKYYSEDNNTSEDTSVIDNKENIQNIKENNDMENKNQEIIDVTDFAEEIISSDSEVEIKGEVIEEPGDDKPIDLNDVPATKIDVDDKLIINRLNSDFKGISDDDVLTLLDVMKRYKAGEKFNVYSSLPKIFQMEILKAAEDSDVHDRSVLNFFAKNFINDLVSDVYMSEEIDNFTTEMESITKGIDNVPGLIVDTYTDDLKDKFENTLIKAAEEVKETDPDKSEKLLTIVQNFRESYSLKRIIDDITERPSLANRAYKMGRDRWNTVVLDSKNKFENSNPRIRSIDTVYSVLSTYSETKNFSELTRKALCVLLHNSMMEAVKDESVENHIYAYYLTAGFINIRFTSNNSEIVNELIKNVIKVLTLIDNIIEQVQSSKKGKKKKRK